ncbi:MAG: 16S rRNA processing protein RimM, partial [Spirochaetes bacterium]|nr:16S rRNA processing protein RimM [Spirochaetota bacterium]
DDSSYYYYDLIGCSVRTLSGDILGDVYNIQNTGSCDIYFVRSQDEGKKELLVPAISQVIKKIDIAEKEIIIEVIDGLF